jgi:hypothetical protein
MKIKTLLLCCFIALFMTFPLFAQFKKKSKSDCNQVIALSIGAHRMFVDGPEGINVGFGIENVVQRYITFGVELRGFQNKTGYFILDNKQKPIEEVTQHKLALNLGLNLYPMGAFRGFFTGVAFGAVYATKIRDNRPPVWINGIPPLSSGIEMMSDLKLGFQHVHKKSGFVWNVYGGAGLIIPTLKGETYPFFEAGLKLGKRL